MWFITVAGIQDLRENVVRIQRYVDQAIHLSHSRSLHRRIFPCASPPIPDGQPLSHPSQSPHKELDEASAARLIPATPEVLDNLCLLELRRVGPYTLQPVLFSKPGS